MITVTTKIIFLDVDGVLNCDDTWETEHAEGFATLDPTMCDRLASIVNATGAMIVLSSTWRTAKPKGDSGWEEDPRNEWRCMPKLIEWLAERGMTIHSHTPDLCEHEHVARGFEIESWFAANPEFAGSKFLILDDLNEYHFLKDQRPFLVKTDMRAGLQDFHVEQAITLLS